MSTILNEELNKELSEEIIWYKENLKVGQTIQFNQTFKPLDNERIKEYTGVYLGLQLGAVTLSLSIGIYDRDNEIYLRKTFYTSNLSDLHNSSLPKEIVEGIKERFLESNKSKENDAKCILQSLGDKGVRIHTFKENSFLLLVNELKIVEDDFYYYNKLYNLRNHLDIVNLRNSYPNYMDNFVKLSDTQLNYFINTNKLSIEPFVYCKKSSTKRTIYYQAFEITVNNTFSNSEIEEIIKLLNKVSNI